MESLRFSRTVLPSFPHHAQPMFLADRSGDISIPEVGRGRLKERLPESSVS